MRFNLRCRGNVGVLPPYGQGEPNGSRVVSHWTKAKWPLKEPVWEANYTSKTSACSSQSGWPGSTAVLQLATSPSHPTWDSKNLCRFEAPESQASCRTNEITTCEITHPTPSCEFGCALRWRCVCVCVPWSYCSSHQSAYPKHPLRWIHGYPLPIVHIGWIMHRASRLITSCDSP